MSIRNFLQSVRNVANRARTARRQEKQMRQRRQRFVRLGVEHLEDRIVPSTLEIVNGQLNYFAGTFVNDNLSISRSGSNYVFTDTADNINLGSGTAGWSGSGTHTVTGPASSFDAIELFFGDSVNTVSVLSTGVNVSVNDGYSAGNVHIVVGNSGNGMQSIAATVADLTQSASSVLMNDVADATARGVTVNKNFVNGLEPTGGVELASNDLQALTIDGGSGGNTFTVQSTVASATTNLNTGSGNDNVNVLATSSPLNIDTQAGSNGVSIGSAAPGLQGTLDNILGAVHVASTNGFTELLLEGAADPVYRTVTITNSSITGLSPAAVSYNAASVGRIGVYGGTAGDTFNVQSTNGEMLIFSSAPSSTPSTINVGNNGSVQGVQGVLETFGSINLNVNDSADTSARNVTLSATPPVSDVFSQTGQITGLAPAVISYVYSSTANLTIDGGSGGDTFNVQTTGIPGFAAPVTNIIGGGYYSTINVGNNGSVQGIQGALNIENPPAINTINVNDANDTTFRTVTLENTTSPFSGDPDSWGAIVGLSPGVIKYEYPDTSSLTVDGGTGGDSLSVLQTGVTTNFVAGYYSTINVGNNGSVQGIRGTLNLENPPAYNSIVVNDTNDTTTRSANISTLGTNPSDSQGNTDPWGTLTGLAPAAINWEYFDTSSVTVDLPNAYFINSSGNTVGSSITVTPIAGLEYFIHGNPNLGAPGNSLTVSNVNGTIVDHPTGTYAGYFTFQNSTTPLVSYTGIQSPSPIGLLVASTDAGISPEVKVYNAQTGDLKFDLHPFTSSFLGGVRVAVGDLNGDGVPDIIAAEGPGGAGNGDSLVQVFDGLTGQQLAGPLGLFDPFPGFHGGLYVASADLTGSGYADLIVAQGAGGNGLVNIYSGKNGALLEQFQPYGANYTGGVRVAAGPVTGHVDVVTGEGPGGPPLVDVFDGPNLVKGVATPVASFDAFAPSFTGGVYVATGLISGQGHPPADIVVGEGAGGEPRVSVFNGAGTPLGSFLAFAPGFHGGVRVATADVTGSGRSDIIAAQGPGAGSLPQVRAFDGVTLQQIDQFFAFPADQRNGMFVAGGGKWGLFHEVSTTGSHPPVEQKSAVGGDPPSSNSSDPQFSDLGSAALGLDLSGLDQVAAALLDGRNNSTDPNHDLLSSVLDNLTPADLPPFLAATVTGLQGKTLTGAANLAPCNDGEFADQ